MGLFDRFLHRDEPPANGVSVDDALLLLSQGAALIDVRPLSHYEKAHIPGSRPVDVVRLLQDPLSEIHGDNPLAEVDKPVVVVCATGKISADICRVLDQHYGPKPTDATAASPDSAPEPTDGSAAPAQPQAVQDDDSPISALDPDLGNLDSPRPGIEFRPLIGGLLAWRESGQILLPGPYRPR